MQRDSWIDYLRVTAVILVVILHAKARVLSVGANSGIDFYMAITLRNITTFGVPLFFMMTGYLYLNKQHLYAKDFYVRRLWRVVLPFVVWSYIWLAYQGYDLTQTAIIMRPITTPSMYHLWFMYPLICLYLFMPLLFITLRRITPQAVWCILAIWLAIGLLIYFPPHDLKSNNLLIWAGYAIAGAAITRKDTLPRWLLAPLLITITCMVFASIALYGHKIGAIAYNIRATHTMIACCLVFALACQMQHRLPESKVITYLSQRSYCVYLIHPFFIELFDQALFPSNQLPFYYIAVVPSLTLASAFAFSGLVKMLRLQRVLG